MKMKRLCLIGSQPLDFSPIEGGEEIVDTCKMAQNPLISGCLGEIEGGGGRMKEAEAALAGLDAYADLADTG